MAITLRVLNCSRSFTRAGPPPPITLARAGCAATSCVTGSLLQLARIHLREVAVDWPRVHESFPRDRRYRPRHLPVDAEVMRFTFVFVCY